MSARSRARVSGTASVVAIGVSAILSAVCPVVGLPLLALSTVATTQAQGKLADQIEEEDQQVEFAREVRKQNAAVAEVWRENRPATERVLRIDRSVERERSQGGKRTIRHSEIFEIQD